MEVNESFMLCVVSATQRRRRRLHLYFVALMDRCGERFGEICYSPLPEILFHLPDFNSERFIAENVANPARKIAATRMTFQGCSRQSRLQGDEFFQGARAWSELVAIAGENKCVLCWQWDLEIFRTMPNMGSPAPRNGEALGQIARPIKAREHRGFIDAQVCQDCSPLGFRAFRATQHGERVHFDGISHRSNDDGFDCLEQLGMQLRWLVGGHDIGRELEIDATLVRLMEKVMRFIDHDPVWQSDTPAKRREHRQ